MRDKGYTFMDSDAAGNAIWTFPVVLALFCWNLIPRFNHTPCYLCCRSLFALEVSECLLH